MKIPKRQANYWISEGTRDAIIILADRLKTSNSGVIELAVARSFKAMAAQDTREKAAQARREGGR